MGERAIFLSMFNLKAVAAVAVVASLLSIPLYFYWDFLTRGMRPPEATQILNQMEQGGVPDFTIQDLEGRSIALSSFRGKLLLINIWATWCSPCVKEFPSLKGLVEHFKNDIEILAVSEDKNLEDITSFIRAFGGLPENFKVVWDKDKQMKKLFGTDALPETYIISRDGKMIRKVAGDTIWDDAMALEYFRGLLKTDSDKIQ